MFTHVRVLLLSILVLGGCCQINPALAWDRMGHQVIAAIALKDLTPSTQKAIDRLLGEVQRAYPGIHTLIEASTWADEIRSQHIHVADHWHYINKPYLSVRGLKPKARQQENIVWAIHQIQSSLRSSRVPLPLQAWFLLWEIHLIADIHQPMHCIEYYSPLFPRGDSGGNRYPVSSRFGDHLHEVWDRGVGYFQITLNERNPNRIANKIRSTYPRAYFSKSLARHRYPKAWAEESYQLGRKIAYQTPPGAELTPAYIKKSQAIVAQQLALAGYRLADQLNAIFDSPLEKNTLDCINN